MNWVVRGGIATADRLIAGYGPHIGVTGLFGFSVQYQPGQSVNEIAKARRFPNGQISIAYDVDLRAALAPLGYTMRIVRSPGRGYHHTFAVLYDATGQMLQSLPRDAADALAATFRQINNPYLGQPYSMDLVSHGKRVDRELTSEPRRRGDR
jgi:hypothetical protein